MSFETDRADLNKQVDSAIARIQAHAMRVHIGLEHAVENSVAAVERTSKKLMTNATVDTSKSVGRRGHHPSVPGSAPAPDFGTERRSITHNVTIVDGRVVGYTGSVLKDPPYPAYHEHGTSTMAPRPWLLPSIVENRDYIHEQFRSAGHGEEVRIENATD